MYFIKKKPGSLYGVKEVIAQTRTQRRLKLGDLNGKAIFSDERDDKRPDHAYDPLRYYVALHSRAPKERHRTVPENSFMGIRRRFKLLKQVELSKGFAKPGI